MWQFATLFGNVDIAQAVLANIASDELISPSPRKHVQTGCYRWMLLLYLQLASAYNIYCKCFPQLTIVE